MKAERRQELRTNELAQQLDQAGEYIKQNAAAFTAVVVIAAIIVGGVFWYVRRQQNTLMQGWSALTVRNAAPDAPAPIDEYKSVAEENLDPTLTVQAWLKVADAAMTEMVKSKKAGAVPSDKNWAAIAEDAFNQAASRSSKDIAAQGQAWIGLGILAENKGEFDKARQSYQKVVDDARFADSPLKLQASYRIENMKSWSAPVVFPPPPPPASAPASQPAIDLPLPTTEVPVTPRKVEEASKALTPEPPAANKQPAEGAAKVPSTQPAGS